MTHDKFCMDHGLIGVATADCTCKEIAAIRADEREQAARRVREVFCTCGECELDGAEAAAVFAAARGGEQA